jgi:hypothetical protein
VLNREPRLLLIPTVQRKIIHHFPLLLRLQANERNEPNRLFMRIAASKIPKGPINQEQLFNQSLTMLKEEKFAQLKNEEKRAKYSLQDSCENQYSLSECSEREALNNYLYSGAISMECNLTGRLIPNIISDTEVEESKSISSDSSTKEKNINSNTYQNNDFMTATVKNLSFIYNNPQKQDNETESEKPEHHHDESQDYNKDGDIYVEINEQDYCRYLERHGLFLSLMPITKMLLEKEGQSTKCNSSKDILRNKLEKFMGRKVQELPLSNKSDQES